MKEEMLMTGKLEPTKEGYALAKIVGLKLLEGMHNLGCRAFVLCLVIYIGPMIPSI